MITREVYVTLNLYEYHLRSHKPILKFASNNKTSIDIYVIWKLLLAGHNPRFIQNLLYYSATTITMASEKVVRN